MASAPPIQGEMEESKCITKEMFEKVGIETKPAEVEKSPLEESEEAIESCEESNEEKCKGNVLSEPAGFVADEKLIFDEIPSTYSQKEILIADDSLSKETENEEQLAKSPPPALEESTISNIDTLNPSETILQSSAEQGRQKKEASAAQVEEVQSQLSETSNYSGELVGDVKDDVSGKRDDFSTEMLDRKTEDVETSTKTSLLKVDDQNYHIISDANVEASNLSRKDKEHEKFSCVAHQALEGDRNIAASAEDNNLEDNVSNKKEDPQSSKDEMFNKLGVEATVDEIEESSSKELAEATKFCETNLEKCKNNILSEPVESAADGNLITGDIQSTFFKTEVGIADDSLSKKTENQQLAESPPSALEENNVSVTDSEKPTETILNTSVEEDNQKMEASTAKVEEIHTQIKEVSNFLGARVVEKRDEFTGKRDETSTEGSDDKTEGIKTDLETSPLDVEDQDDHTKSATNVGASDLSRSEDDEEDEQFINLADGALEEDMNIGKSAEDDNLEDSNLNKTEEPQRFKGETLDKDGIEAETSDIEQNLSKEVQTIEVCETNLEKLKESAPSDPVELAADVNLIVSEVQNSHDGSHNKASLEEHEAPFDKIQTDKRTENEDSSEGDQCGKPSEVETEANPEEEKLEITKVDKLLDVSELLLSEEKTQAVVEKTSYEIVNANAVLNEQINEVVDKSSTNSKEDVEKKNVTQTEGLATETSESGNNGKDIPVFEPKPQDNLGVSEEQSHVPEILQEYQNQDLENQKNQTMGNSCELDTRDENKEIVETEQLTEKSCQPNEKSSSGDKLDNHANDTLHSGSSTGGLDVPNKYSSVDETYGEETLKQGGDGDRVNELANEMAIEHSVPQQEESIDEEVNFTVVATEGGSVKSCEGSNKEHDEDEAPILQENIVEMKEKNTKDVFEPVTINKGQSTHSQNETPISDERLSGETGNEQFAKPPPLALNVHTISVADSEKPTEPILGTSVEEDVRSIEPSAAKVEEIHYESSTHSGTVVIETKDDVTEKKEFSAEDSDNKIGREIETETILSEEKNDQTASDENERTIIKSEQEEKDDKFSNIATEALDEDMNTVTKTEDDNPGDNNSNSKWNERTLDLEEPKKETQKGEEVSTTFIDDQNNETSESLLGIREDVKSKKEVNLVNDKMLEEGYKLNLEDKLLSVDAKVNAVEKEDSATNLQKGAASEEFHHETPEKYKIQSKEDKINMLDADGKTSIDDLHVEAPKPQVEASNTLPIEQDFMTVATTHVIESESSVDADDLKNLNNALEANIRPAKEIDKGLSEMHLDSTDFKESKLIQETIEAKEDMEMEKLEKQYESATKEPNHEDSSDEQYLIVEIPIDKEFADEMVHNELPVQVSEDVEEVSISEPIIHTKEIDFVNESIMNPASVEAEKEGSIDESEISDCEHIVQTEADGHIDDDQLTLESEESIEGQGASLASLTSEHVHIEDASTSAQDSTKMKEVCSRSDPEETTFPTEPAENKEPLVQDDEKLMIANRDQSEEIQTPDEDENKEDFDKNLVQGEQAELIPQEVKSSDEDMASQKMIDGQQQVHDIIDNITIKLDPSKVKQDSGTAPSENNVAEIQNTSAMGDKNSTFGDLSGKHNYDEIELVQSTEGHELESVVEGSCQEQPTHVNEVIEETTDKWEETAEPHSIKTDEKLNDPNKIPEVEDQHEATMILQGVAKDERTTSTTIIDTEEKECDSGYNSFSNKKDEENQDASAIVDQISTIADTDELQNNETASIELTERNKAENSVGGYPEEQHANDATKETVNEDSIRHEELTTDHSIEKEQNNEVATEIGESGSMGHEELLIEKKQNLRKQTLSMEVEDIQETVTPQCVTEDKQLPGQITDMTRELGTDEKEQNPVTASSETALEDSSYSKKDDDSKDDLATLVGTSSIRDDDEKHQDEEQPVNWTKRNEYESTTEGIAEEQPIQASEVTVEAGASGLISYGTVPEDLASGFLEKEETLGKQTTSSEAMNSQETSSLEKVVEEQQLAVHVTDATTELDQELNVATTGSETIAEDLAGNKENEDCKGDSAKADGTGTMEAEDEKHGDKKMSIKLTEINEKETIVGCSEEEKIFVSEVPMDAGERDSRKYEEITQHSSMRHEELVEEPSTEEEEILSKQTLTMEMECIPETLAPQAVSEDKQLPEQITDVTKELNTQEKEQNPITASADIAMEDSFSSKKDEDSKGNLATIDGRGSIEDEDEKHHDEEQPIKLPERNEYEDVVEGRHEEQQIHVSEVTVKGGESDLISYEEVPEHHFIEKEETLSKQTTTLEVTDSHSPKGVLEIQQPTGNVTDVTIELDHVRKELNMITTSSEIAVKDFTSNKEDDANKTDSAIEDGTGIMGAENEKLDDEKQSNKLTEINEHETTFKSCPEEEQICPSDVSFDAGESGSRSYDESIQHPSIEKEQALIKPTTVVEVMYSQETITEERVTQDQQLARHAIEVTSELGQDKNELNFVSTKSETTLEDYVSEKEDGGNSVKVDVIGSMGDVDDKNGDEDCLEDHQICASEVTTEAGHSGSMRYDELTKQHPVEKEQITSKLANGQDSHTLERSIEGKQPIEHITDDSTELEQEEKEQNFVTASSETALEDTFGNQEEEQEGASAPVDDLGSIGDEVGKQGDKEKPMECAERNTLGMMAETDLEKHPANPKELTSEAGDVGLMACGETAKNNLTDKDLLNEPPITLMVEQNIHKKEEESIHVANNEGECTKLEHVNDDQMLDREVIVNQPDKLKLNVTTDDVLVDKSSQEDSITEHREERRNQEVNISDSTIGEKSTETTAATITEVESCANNDSEKLVDHPDGNNKQIDPQDVTEQKEKAPNSETSEEVTLDNKLQVDETRDTLGNDGQNVMKEEVASESRIQYMAVPSSGEILEELKAPGILDDTAEHATKKVKDVETSDTLLSQEGMVDDRIQSEENSNVPNDACNPDKQISEAEDIFCTIKGTNQVEIKDSALEPTDAVSETNLISDALQKADLTQDEDSAFKTNDELTTVTTLTEINTEEEMNDISKNDLVNEEVNEVIDSASLMEEGNFKDEKDRAKRELETEVENAETSNHSVEFTETTVEHTENTEDKAKVWKVEKALTAAMETKIDEATLADKTYTEMPTAEKIISDGISEETMPKEDETSLVSACDTTEEKVEVIEEIEIVSKDIELNKTMGQAQEAQEEVTEMKVDDTNVGDNTSLEPQTVETSTSDDLVEANGLKHDDSSSVSVPEIIREGSIKEEEEEIIKRDERQPQLTVENANTSHYNIESAIKTVLPTEKTEEKEVSENLEEASQLETGLKSETLIVDETISESTTAETNISDDFVHVGKPGDEEKGSFSGSVSTPGEPMEPKHKSINETSEVFVEELAHEENRKETGEKDKEQDINAENSNSEVDNEDTKSLSADGMDRKHETADTDKGCSGLSPPVEFTSVVLNEESQPKDEEYSSTSTTETNELTDLSKQLKEEDNLKDVLVGFSADKSCKEKEDENVDYCEKIEEKTGLVDSNQRTEATPEKEAQGLPHAKHQAAHLEEQNNGEKQQDKGEEGKIEEDNQVKNTDKNMGKLNPDPVSIKSEAPEESLTAVVEEDKLAVNADGEEEKTDEEKDREAEHEHKEEEPESEAPVMGEASREANLKPSPKKAHNLLSGVGSKVKHSISKVKKAITGKSSHSKSPAPKSS